MFRKVATLVIVLPLAAIIIAFAVANRQLVTVSFDPFTNVDPAYAATLPLFILIFVLTILGVIVGGTAAWLRQAHWRRTARKLDGEVRQLQQELSALRNRYAAEAHQPAEPVTTYFDPTPPAAIAPPRPQP
ncbi:MAG: LapA family protein [Pseudolabrys sp.]|nr:LapA family protein [Pseudolabrys sp.]MDP2295019.1 LapA family protein [Pseudolabrys sp.]